MTQKATTIDSTEDYIHMIIQLVVSLKVALLIFTAVCVLVRVTNTTTEVRSEHLERREFPLNG